MKLATDITAGDAWTTLIDKPFYTIHGSYNGTQTVQRHKCVAVYNPAERQGYGIRIVDEAGLRYNPASQSGIYTELADVAEIVVSGYNDTVQTLQSRAAALTDQLATTNEELAKAIVLRGEAQALVVKQGSDQALPVTA